MMIFGTASEPAARARDVLWVCLAAVMLLAGRPEAVAADPKPEVSPVERAKAEQATSDRLSALRHLRQAASELTAQSHALEAALGPQPELRQQFLAEIERLKWPEGLAAWQRRAEALEEKLSADAAAVEEAAPLEKELQRFRSPLTFFWFRKLGFQELLLAHRPRNCASHIYTYQEEFGRGGGRLVAFTPRVDGESWRTLVDAGEGRIHRYDLSFDAREVVFAWQKKRSEPFHIYRINVDGTGLTQLTSGPAHDFDPCWLPDGDIAFVSSRDQQWACVSGPRRDCCIAWTGTAGACRGFLMAWSMISRPR